MKKDNTSLNKVKITPEVDFWNDLPIAVKQSINEAKAQLDREEGIPHDVIMRDVKARFLSCKGK
jgi:hypothetical protein